MRLGKAARSSNFGVVEYGTRRGFVCLLGLLPLILARRALGRSARREVVFMFGIPGAGKTTIATTRFARYRIIDPDVMRPREFRHAIEEFRADLLSKVAAANAANIVFSETSNADRPHVEAMMRLMQKSRQAGYKVRLVYVKTDVATALARIATRRRKVARSRVRAQAATIEAHFRFLVRFADRVDVIRN